MLQPALFSNDFMVSKWVGKKRRSKHLEDRHGLKVNFCKSGEFTTRSFLMIHPRQFYGCRVPLISQSQPQFEAYILLRGLTVLIADRNAQQRFVQLERKFLIKRMVLKNTKCQPTFARNFWKVWNRPKQKNRKGIQVNVGKLFQRSSGVWLGILLFGIILKSNLGYTYDKQYNKTTVPQFLWNGSS